MKGSVTTLQLTLAIIKPHIMKVPYVLQRIRDIIISNGFYVVRTKHITLNLEQASNLYMEHKCRFYYNRLVTFMCSGPVDVHILAREDAINVWRQLMGPTKVYQAQFTAPDTIRGSYGLTDTRNATHGSDSPKSTGKEIKILFPEFNVEKWLDTEEIHFRFGSVKFNPDHFIHNVQAN